MALLHADLALPAVVHGDDGAWEAETAGMSAKVLERLSTTPTIGTSLLRWAAGAGHGPHEHAVAQDIFVLEGTLTDDSGDHPAGTFLHYPAGSAHDATTRDGCLMLVKARRCAPGDHACIVNTDDGSWYPAQLPGVSIMPLYNQGIVRVALLRFDTGTGLAEHDHPDGEEFFVLKGTLRDEHGVYPTGSWVRQPVGSKHSVTADRGCTLYSTAGHLL